MLEHVDVLRDDVLSCCGPQRIHVPAALHATLLLLLQNNKNLADDTQLIRLA